MIYLKYALSLCVAFLLIGTAQATITLPSVFCDHMVLQQNSTVKVWGWGRPEEPVAVIASWSTDSVNTKVNNQCRWSVELPTPKAGGPYLVIIKGYNTITLTDVMIGEVWLLAGQSNMEWCAEWKFDHSEEETTKADHPNIRLFSVSHRSSQYPSPDVVGEWAACTPETMKGFSAIGYFFGRTLSDSLNVPIGLINTAWGGSPIEIWMEEGTIAQDTFLLNASKKIKEMGWSPREPGRAYNAMIAPLMPYGLAGALWYQGETNTSNAQAYTKMLSAMVSSWRKGFQKDFAFYYAQIAPWSEYGPTSGAIMREAQRRALDVIENSGMVVVSDIGDTTNIHPANKLEAGIRFANLALNKTYGMAGLPHSGPMYRSFTTEGNKVLIDFENGEGLYTKGDALNMFELKDAKGNWHPAKAKIKKGIVEVSNSKVKAPVGVRFAWHSAATPLLFNNEHLPASCFTSDPELK